MSMNKAPDAINNKYLMQDARLIEFVADEVSNIGHVYIRNDEIFIGSTYGNVNSIGNQNIFIGTSTGNINNLGTQNTMIGMYSGSQNTDGIQNTFLVFYPGIF